MLVAGYCHRDGCGEPFTVVLDEEEGDELPDPALYCSPRCKRAARKHRKKAERRASKPPTPPGAVQPCVGCGRVRDSAAIYGVPLCPRCRNVALGTCWRKIRFPTCNAAGSNFVNGDRIWVYRCELCDGFHTTRTPQDEVSADLRDLRAQLAEAFRSAGFDQTVVPRKRPPRRVTQYRSRAFDATD